MSWALRINRVLLTLLSFATGAVKLARMEQEMQIFAQAGFSSAATVGFGVLQFVGAVLLLPQRTTRWGAGLMAASFVVATGVLLVNSMWAFGAFSLLFIASAGVHARWAHSLQQS